MILLLLVHSAVTWAMSGLIWFIQINHYPLFSRVGREAFKRYQEEHMRRTTWVVAPLMGIEAVTGILLLWYPPANTDLATVWCGMVLLAVIWVSTALLQVPRHQRLLGGFDETDHQSLVSSNWIRTLAWTGRSAVCLFWIWEVARPT